MALTLAEIVSLLGGNLIGDGTVLIEKVASIEHATSGQISFLSNKKYSHLLQECKASAIVLGSESADLISINRIIVDQPYVYFARLSALFNPPSLPNPGIANTAVIDTSANISDSATIGDFVVIESGVHISDGVVIDHGCVIKANSHIGENSWIQSNVTIYNKTSIGARCLIASGAVIGADGFGYAETESRWVKIPQVGRVVIEDDVEIGANTTIDRGALDDTIIHVGVKIDNLVQIGHNCIIGAHTAIAGCVGIAGSAKIGSHCKIGGAAMVLGHLKIVDHVTITPGSMITRSLLTKGTYTALMPFQRHEDWLKTAAQLRHLDSLIERVKLLEKKLATNNDK